MVFKILLVLLFLSTDIQAKTKSASSPYSSLSKYLHQSFKSINSQKTSEIPTIESIRDALQGLSNAQSTFKSIDGASHEFYQRSHNVNTIKGSTGRVERSAGRVGCCADALFGCELIDFMNARTSNATVHEAEDRTDENEGTLSLHHREIILETRVDGPIPTRILVIYEKDYNGGAGMNHGGIDAIAESHDSKRNNRGRILVVLRDEYDTNLDKTLQCIDKHPEFLDLNIGLVSGEIVCVNKMIWQTAQKVLQCCAEALGVKIANAVENATMIENSDTIDEQESEFENTESQTREDVSDSTQEKKDSMLLPAIHFIGRSLGGGIASVSAAMLEGSIPMEKTKQKKNRKRKKDKDSDSTSVQSLNQAICGFGQGRTSAVSLGAPPSISANIKASFITSVIYGDDIICRATRESFDRLRKRTMKRIKGGVFAGLTGGLTDTISLTVSSMQSHAHGSEGEEARLSIPGNVYLIRPRRISGGVSSIHEIGKGRDALRAAILWQLNDILLSNSLWKHHSLESYIKGIDKVQLREIDMEDSEEELQV